MNILIASIFSFDSYSRGIMPDVLQTQINENPGAKIFYLTNSNSFDICYFNIEKRPENCYRCKVGVKSTLKLIEGEYQHIVISDLLTEEDLQIANSFFSTNQPIRIDQVFENFEVGAATISTYISRTRDRDLLEVKQPFVRELAVNALALYLATKRFLSENNIDVVFNFNGRQDYVRAIMRAALASEVDCYNVERARAGGFIEFYRNVLPHNIMAKKALVEDCWKSSDRSLEKKIELASEFFKRQRAGESVIFPSYLTRQKKDQLPKGIDNGNKNIVLFNSSDDEFAALGEEFKNPHFSNQNEALEYLVDIFGTALKGFNLIIRMHPNLTGVKFEYVEKLKNLHKKFPNIFVVLPDSEIDSYGLIDIASKVITFGSTIGIEANFYGKPVILLGKCFYYFSNVAYTPVNVGEIRKFISEPLEPLPRINSLKFGFYYLYGGKKSQYYYEEHVDDYVFFKGKKIHQYSLFQRIFSKIIGKTYHWFGTRLKF